MVLGVSVVEPGDIENSSVSRAKPRDSKTKKWLLLAVLLHFVKNFDFVQKTAFGAFPFDFPF